MNAIALGDLRERIRADVVRDLEMLGVDRAFLRWQAARAYIRQTHDEALAEIGPGLERICMLDRAQSSWRRRGRPGWGPDATDIADAQLWAQHTFGHLPFAATATPVGFRPATDAKLLSLARDQEGFERKRRRILDRELKSLGFAGLPEGPS